MVQREAHTLGPMAPGKLKYARQADHQHRQHGQRGTGEAQPARCHRPHGVAQRTPCVARQHAVKPVKPAPLQHRTGQHEQQQTDPKSGWMQPDALPATGCIQRVRVGLRRTLLTPKPAGQPRKPGLHARQETPPNRKARQVIADIGQQSPELACPIAHIGSAAGGAPSRIGRRMAQQSEQTKRQRCRAQHQPHFLAEPARAGRWLPGKIGIERVEQIGHGYQEEAAPTLTHSPELVIRPKGLDTAISNPVPKARYVVQQEFPQEGS